MTKQMRELAVKMAAKQAEVEKYLADGENKDLEKAATAMDEVEQLQKEYDILERLEAKGKAGVHADKDEGAATDPSVKALADAARNGFRGKDLNEGSGIDGGYTVPEDVQTHVNRYKEARFSLGDLIDHENVTTESGRRTYQKRSQHQGFTKVGEGGKIPKTAAPQFEVMEYKISKYAGYLPVTNELLEDSDAAIHNTIVEWLGEEGIATDNNNVIALMETLEAVALTGLKDIKKVLTVTLALFRNTAKIVTNSDGIHYLDTLEDKNGRPLLSPDPAHPMEMYLSVGTRRIPVVEVPNEILPTAEGGKVPVWMGDFKAFAKKFDRKKTTITVSNIAAVGDFNAFEQDMTLFRAIEREDFQVKDNKAVVRGELTLPTA